MLQITKFCETFKIENKQLLVKVLIKKRANKHIGHMRFLSWFGKKLDHSKENQRFSVIT